MASGDVLHRWQAKDGEPPSATFAVLIRRNNHFFAGFDAATDWALDFSDVLDRKYAGGGVTAVIIWAAASATTGDVVWTGAWERHEDDAFDLDADGFATANTATGTTASATGEVQYTSITFTNGAQMDSVAVGESFRFRVTRDADNGADTMAGNAQLKAVEIRET
jgi:hypothetical protein